MSIRGKDVTSLMSDPPPYRPQAQQQGAYRPTVQSQGEYAPLVSQPQVTYGGRGQWRTVFKAVDGNRKEIFTETRPEVKTTGNIVHIHSERFDWIMGIDKVEVLEVEYGELPPVVVQEPVVESTAQSVEEFEDAERAKILAEIAAEGPLFEDEGIAG